MSRRSEWLRSLADHYTALLVDEWSDEARLAAAEARSRNAAGHRKYAAAESDTKTRNWHLQAANFHEAASNSANLGDKPGHDDALDKARVVEKKIGANYYKRP